MRSFARNDAGASFSEASGPEGETPARPGVTQQHGR